MKEEEKNGLSDRRLSYKIKEKNSFQGRLRECPS